MTDRQKEILKVIIEEYIKDANPVGSKKLAEDFNFGIGSAMIRQEMAQLEKEGYLTHPHTSAGRIPTDKAYRLYISQELNKKKNSLSLNEQEKINKVASYSNDALDIVKEMGRVASELSREFSAAGLIGYDTVYTHGLSQLIDEPEMRNFSHMSSLVRFIDEIDSYFGELWSLLHEEELRVFIGRENPIRPIRDFTLITGRYSLPTGDKGFVSIVGPRRMDYKKNMALVEYISQTIDELTH